MTENEERLINCIEHLLACNSEDQGGLCNQCRNRARETIEYARNNRGENNE